jgi:hypothetical protein
MNIPLRRAWAADMEAGGSLCGSRSTVMRIAYSALLTLLVASAVPSVGVAQVFLPESRLRHDLRLDHVVPVATVSRLGQPIALADAHPVQDASGEPYVLGAATLDLSDPSHATVVFTLTNATETPIPRRSMYVWAHSVWRDRRGLVLPSIDGIQNPNGGARTMGWPGYGVSLSAWDIPETWQPAASITLRMPISQVPKVGEGELQGFLVFVEWLGQSFPARPTSTDSKTGNMLRRAFLELSSRAPQ